MRVLRRFMGNASLYSTIPLYTKIPLHDHYVQLLVKEGLEEAQAKELIAVLDNQVRQQIYQRSSKYLAGKDYVHVLTPNQ